MTRATTRNRIIAVFEAAERTGIAPTVREIGETVGLSSSSTVQVHLHALERDGIIERFIGTRMASRGWRLTREHRRALAAEQFQEVWPRVYLGDRHSALDGFLAGRGLL
jgi:SOS-response transcriptional repressor LexA